MKEFVEIDPEMWQLIISVLPVMGLIVFALIAIARHAFSPSNGMNRRGSAPYSFGGAWTDYSTYTEGDHPDFDEPYETPKRKRPTKRQGKRR